MVESMTSSISPRGALLLVVGPSGAGKDSVIGWARERLDNRNDVVFARRTITRRADAGGEIHEPVSESQFEAMSHSGAFLLAWRSHGLCYGISAKYRRDLENGRVVVANTSRTVVQDALAAWPRVVVAHIVSSPEALAARLIARGRESDGDIAQRLTRAPVMETGDAIVESISNDGELAEAGARLIRIIEATLRCADAERPRES